MKGVRQCSVVFDDKTRCKRLALKTINGEWICSKCYRKFKNELIMEHVLGKSKEESKASMDKALREDDVNCFHLETSETAFRNSLHAKSRTSSLQ